MKVTVGRERELSVVEFRRGQVERVATERLGHGRRLHSRRHQEGDGIVHLSTIGFEAGLEQRCDHLSSDGFFALALIATSEREHGGCGEGKKKR